MRSRIDRCSNSPSALPTRRGARSRKKVPSPRGAPSIGAPAPSGKPHPNRRATEDHGGRRGRASSSAGHLTAAMPPGHANLATDIAMCARKPGWRLPRQSSCPETRLAPASRASRRCDSTGSANRQFDSRQWPDRGNHGEHVGPDGHRGIPSPSAPAATGPDRAGGPGSRQRPGHPASRSARERGSDGA